MNESFLTMLKSITYVPTKRGKVKILIRSEAGQTKVVMSWKKTYEIGNDLRDVAMEAYAMQVQREESRKQVEE